MLQQIVSGGFVADGDALTVGLRVVYGVETELASTICICHDRLEDTRPVLREESR